MQRYWELFHALAGRCPSVVCGVQDALRSANSQIRMLRCEVAALHEQIDCCAASGPPTPPSDPSVDPTGSQAETLNGEAVTDTASAKGDVEELQVLFWGMCSSVGKLDGASR